MPKNHRWEYDVQKSGPLPAVPEFLMIGYDEIHRAIDLGYHRHEGYEFVFLERGQAGWELNSRLYETRAGDVFHTRPGEIHRGGFNAIEPSRFWWLLVAPPDGDNWLRLPADETAAIRVRLEQLSRVASIGALPLEPLRRLRAALQAREVQLQPTVVRQAVLDALLHVLQPIQAGDALAVDLVQQFERLIARSREEPSWRPSVEALAELARISPSHFMRTFRHYTGFSPIAYLERQRIKHACELLSGTQQSILEISSTLGYASSQHFATAFKRVTRMTPLAWRKSARE